MLSFCLTVTFCCYCFIFFFFWLSAFFSLLLQKEEEKQGCDQQQFEIYQFLFRHGVLRIKTMFGLGLFSWGGWGGCVVASFMRGGDEVITANLKASKFHFNFLAKSYIWSFFPLLWNKFGKCSGHQWIHRIKNGPLVELVAKDKAEARLFLSGYISILSLK